MIYRLLNVIAWIFAGVIVAIAVIHHSTGHGSNPDAIYISGQQPQTDTVAAITFADSEGDNADDISDVESADLAHADDEIDR